MAKQLQSFSLAFLLFILIVPLFEAFEALDDFEKFEEKLGLKKHNEDSSRDSQVVTLTCDGPVTFDATIKFRTEFFAPDAKPPFFYSWSDDASPRHMEEQESHETVAHWNITYPSKKDYEAREYRTTVYIYSSGFWGRDYVGESTVTYKVTRDLNGKMEYEQKIPIPIPHMPNMVRSTEGTELSVKVHDPSKYLDGAMLQYYWFVNRTNYGLTENNSFTYNFYPPGRFEVECILIAHVPGSFRSDDKKPVTVNQEVSSVLNSTENRNMTTQQLQNRVTEVTKTVVEPPFLKTGIFQITLESRTPITKYNYTGETWINAGKLLKINMTCDGSGPWSLCWGAKPVPYNVSGNETCDDPGMGKKVSKGDSCHFPIMWYFRDPGVHNVLAIVSNQVSWDSKVILVNMYNSTIEPPLSVVVIPVTCSLISVCGIAAGMFTFYLWRKNDAIETADFDFNSPEEQLEYKTFWERLRDSMLNAFSNSSDDVSHVSSVSSRSIQNPVTGIHYGSIS